MKTLNKPILYIVIPCYNEQEVLPITYQLFTSKIEELIKEKIIKNNSKVLFVNDGSSDETWDIIKKLSMANKCVEGISLSRNRGHQNAVLAGLMEAKDNCDIAVSIDCDGQDDVDAINKMIEKYIEGYDVVYGVRSSRETDTFFKRFTAESFYKILNIMGVEVVFNHADFRLTSNKVLNEFSSFKEVNLFLRGMFPLVGFKYTTVEYSRKSRIAGESHYPLSKMLALALDGVTSLSIKPIRFITVLGIFISFFSVLFFVINIIKNNHLWAAMCLLCSLFGLLFIGLGIVGEYIGKIYLETKHRPRYIISERTE